MAFIFPNSWDDDPIWRTHIFQGGGSTTNHKLIIRNMIIWISTWYHHTSSCISSLYIHQTITLVDVLIPLVSLISLARWCSNWACTSWFRAQSCLRRTPIGGRSRGWMVVLEDGSPLHDLHGWLESFNIFFNVFTYQTAGIFFYMILIIRLYRHIRWYKRFG